MQNGIVQRTRRTPWIGIGVSGEWSSSAEALEASGLDFTVRQEDLFWQREEDGIVYNERAPMFANVRNEDDRLLGCVTPQYKVIQNREAFSLLDPFLGSGTITHAGMTADGLCFMVAEMEVRTIGGEDYQIDIMATNSFNTKYPCQIILSPVRIVCQNMYRKLINDRLFLAKHTSMANEKLIRLANSNALGKKVLLFSDVIESAQSKPMDNAKLLQLVAMLFPYPKEGGPREVTFKAKTDEMRERFLDVYYDAEDNIRHHGTAFGFVNSYYDYLSHRDEARNMGGSWEDRRFAGLVSGLDIEQQLIRSSLG